MKWLLFSIAFLFAEKNATPSFKTKRWLINFSFSSTSSVFVLRRLWYSCIISWLINPSSSFENWMLQHPIFERRTRIYKPGNNTTVPESAQNENRTCTRKREVNQPSFCFKRGCCILFGKQKSDTEQQPFHFLH